MKLIETFINELYIVECDRFADDRGVLVKLFSDSVYTRCGVNFCGKEDFYSVSRKGVIRGMHFQIPPAGHKKFVYCICGRFLDVVLDCRHGSETYGRFFKLELSADNSRALMLPEGVAHGFLALEDNSMMIYKTSTEREISCESGFRWDSFGFEWPCKDPIVSERDKKLPPFLKVI